MPRARPLAPCGFLDLAHVLPRVLLTTSRSAALQASNCSSSDLVTYFDKYGRGVGSPCAGRCNRSKLASNVTCALQAPVFGSSFGTQGGFAGFTGVAPPKKDADGEEANAGDAEEECKAEFTPLVQLEEVEVNTGEEDEECLLELCALNLLRARVLMPTNVC